MSFKGNKESAERKRKLLQELQDIENQEANEHEEVGDGPDNQKKEPTDHYYDEPDNENKSSPAISKKVTRHELLMPSTEEVGELQNMETGTSIIAKYRTQEDWLQLKDRPVKCYFMGMKDIPNDEGEIINCGVFAEKGGVFLSAQMVLVDAVQSLESGTPICITYLGKKKNKSNEGSTNVFDVQLLR